MSNPVTMVVAVKFNPDAMEAAQTYMEAVGPMLSAAGGEMVRRVRFVKPIIGEAAFDASVMMSFPSAEAIEEVFASDAYKAIIPHREKGFRSVQVAIAEPF